MVISVKLKIVLITILSFINKHNKHNIQVELFTAENKEGELREQPKISSTNS